MDFDGWISDSGLRLTESGSDSRSFFSLLFLEARQTNVCTQVIITATTRLHLRRSTRGGHPGAARVNHQYEN